MIADGMVATMNIDEAQTCEAAIIEHLTSARALIFSFVEREGWRALGYPSWRAWAQTRFGQGQSSVYRMFDAATFERVVTGAIHGEIPESHLRELAPLRSDPAAQRSVWQASNHHSTNTRGTAHRPARSDGGR